MSFLGKSTYLDRTINVLAKRASASVVFGIMHRNGHRHYEFIANSSEEIEKHFLYATDRSVGELALNYLEQYIYACPEEWYEWKKYPEIESLPPFVKNVDMPSSLPVLTPVLGESC
jgi:lauroyl/myristoyl acyltransferase